MATHNPWDDPPPTDEWVEQIEKQTKALYMKMQFHDVLHARRRQALDRRAPALDTFTYKRLLAETSVARTSARDAYRDSLDHYARVSCRQLTHKVVTILPREVRDSIYTYILHRTMFYEGAIDIEAWRFEDMESYVIPRGTAEPQFPPEICKMALGKGEPGRHCWNKIMCGKDFIRELVETCYRLNKFKFRQDSLYLLSLLLGLNHLSDITKPPADIVLPFEHVKKLRLFLKDEKSDMQSTLNGLRCLRELKRNAKIELFITTDTFKSGMQLTTLPDYLQPLVQECLDLVAEGHKVIMRFMTRDEWDMAIRLRIDDCFKTFLKLEIKFHSMLKWALCDCETAYRLYGLTLKTTPSSNNEKVVVPKAD